jgi:hypothetical protein
LELACSFRPFHFLPLDVSAILPDLIQPGVSSREGTNDGVERP